MSLLPNYNVSGSVRFVTESSEDNQFAIVAEASASAQGDVQFKEIKNLRNYTSTWCYLSRIT